MKEKILVTGGSGFIGSAITKYLVEKGHKVTVFDNNSSSRILSEKLALFELPRSAPTRNAL